VCAVLAIVGTKISSEVAGVLVLIKVAVVLFVIVLGLFFISAANYRPFVPAPQAAEAA
jgi:APA family basic amino acid/polyamine antiporter